VPVLKECDRAPKCSEYNDGTKDEEAQAGYLRAYEAKLRKSSLPQDNQIFHRNLLSSHRRCRDDQRLEADVTVLPGQKTHITWS
jgi:hypothetical protein